MEIQLSNAKCTKLSWLAPVELKKEKDDKTAAGNEDFLIEAYTGEVVDRWWGTLAIDVSGIKAKNQIPILLNHNSNQIVGYSTKTYKDKSFFVSGLFSEITDDGKKVKGLADEGFPWQASIGVQALKIMSIEKGSEEKVNGKTVKGPAEIWLESEVFETSFVPLGADGNTSVSTFSKFDEVEQDKEKEEELMEITLEKLEKGAPDLLAQIRSEAETKGLEKGREKGIEAENKRIQDVLSLSIPGHEKLIQELAFDKKTEKAEAAVQVLAAEKRILAGKQEELDKDGESPVTPSSDTGSHLPDKKNPATAEEFEANEELKKEFGDFETFRAYQESVEQGLVKVTKRSA